MSVKSLINKGVTHLTKCFPNDFLDEAITTMVDANRNAVVVMSDDSHMCGILTDHDIIRAVNSLQKKARAMEHEHVFDWMTTNVITCDIDINLSGALKLMGRHKIRHLVVTENARPVAIVSIRDILSDLHDQDLLEANILRDMAMAARVSSAA